MNVRKPIDYSAMFSALDTLITAELPQVELYCGIGHIVSSRPEKGAAVAAAEYLCSAYPDASGFSPRNLRRMREFYRTYENATEVMADAMSIGWTQNVVILEAELTLQERLWYIRAVLKSGWPKLTLLEAINERIHEAASLDSEDNPCNSQDTGSDEIVSGKASWTLLRDLRNAEIQRGLQRERTCGPHMQSLLPALTSTAGGGDDAPASGESDAAPSEQEQDDVAEKPRTQPAFRGAGAFLACLLGKIPSLGTKSEKVEIVYNKAGTVYRWRSLQFMWRACSYKRKPSYLPEATSHLPHTPKCRKPNGGSAGKGTGKVVEVDGTHAGDLLLGAKFFQPCRC